MKTIFLTDNAYQYLTSKGKDVKDLCSTDIIDDLVGYDRRDVKLGTVKFCEQNVPNKLGLVSYFSPDMVYVPREYKMEPVEIDALEVAVSADNVLIVCGVCRKSENRFSENALLAISAKHPLNDILNMPIFQNYRDMTVV